MKLAHTRYYRKLISAREESRSALRYLILCFVLEMTALMTVVVAVVTSESNIQWLNIALAFVISWIFGQALVRNHKASMVLRKSANELEHAISRQIDIHERETTPSMEAAN